VMHTDYIHTHVHTLNTRCCIRPFLPRHPARAFEIDECCYCALPRLQPRRRGFLLSACCIQQAVCSAASAEAHTAARCNAAVKLPRRHSCSTSVCLASLLNSSMLQTSQQAVSVSAAVKCTRPASHWQ